MVRIGTHVHWMRGHDEIGGTVTDRLVGHLDLPDPETITTIIVLTDDGGLEILPEAVVRPDPPLPKHREQS
jgi:hypothetical protein